MELEKVFDPIIFVDQEFMKSMVPADLSSGVIMLTLDLGQQYLLDLFQLITNGQCKTRSPLN